jgi:hypothetical protein
VDEVGGEFGANGGEKGSTKVIGKKAKGKEVTRENKMQMGEYH